MLEVYPSASTLIQPSPVEFVMLKEMMFISPKWTCLGVRDQEQHQSVIHSTFPWSPASPQVLSVLLGQPVEVFKGHSSKCHRDISAAQAVSAPALCLHCSRQGEEGKLPHPALIPQTRDDVQEVTQSPRQLSHSSKVTHLSCQGRLALHHLRAGLLLTHLSPGHLQGNPGEGAHPVPPLCQLLAHHSPCSSQVSHSHLPCPADTSCCYFLSFYTLF